MAMSGDGSPKDAKMQITPGDMEDSYSINHGKVMADTASSDGDVAARYANAFANGDTYSRREAVRLRWKLDMRLVPLLWFNVTLGAMDKVTTATAALYGFREDTDLTGDRYSWVGSAFYVSSVLGRGPDGPAGGPLEYQDHRGVC